MIVLQRLLLPLPTLQRVLYPLEKGLHGLVMLKRTDDAPSWLDDALSNSESGLAELDNSGHLRSLLENDWAAQHLLTVLAWFHVALHSEKYAGACPFHFSFVLDGLYRARVSVQGSFI